MVDIVTELAVSVVDPLLNLVLMYREGDLPPAPLTSLLEHLCKLCQLKRAAEVLCQRPMALSNLLAVLSSSARTMSDVFNNGTEGDVHVEKKCAF